MKSTIRKIIIITVIACLAYGLGDFALEARKAGKYLSPLAAQKTQKPDEYNFLFKAEALKEIQFRHTSYNDRGKILSTYTIGSLNKELLVVALDDSLNRLPTHILIQKSANLMGSFRLIDFTECAISISLEPFSLGNNLSIGYEGIPVHLQRINPNFLYFTSAGLKKLSIDFAKASQSAYILESKRSSLVYETEFALLRTKRGNFLVFLMSKGKGKPDGQLLPKILNV